MKKAALALLLTFLFAGCTSDKQDTAQQNTPKQPDQQQTQPSTQEPAATTPDSQTHDDVRAAYGLSSDYMELPATAIPSLGLGQVEKLALDQKQGLALAKAVTTGISNSGWQTQDSTPGIFISTDGSAFAIGMKKKDGSFSLERFELQADGTYKSTGKETKPAK
ncbi:hypothetical protein JJB07_07225 [Tumebacillus sp. ITR2]|uniref:Lipoprotein n=1 Tax=Tumebacillus amylolyticus TaxID=2801339 RepID=A0ABS1J8B0_9BACL|nr:hypothetical protein [Tumebacillus amylolyticus]MBL0386435.1 hypothetical protein [Tumebacillus amylolyticus]